MGVLCDTIDTPVDFEIPYQEPMHQPLAVNVQNLDKFIPFFPQ